METIVIAIISSGALSALISGLFGLIQNRKSKQKQIEQDLEEIKSAQIRSEKDVLRTQLMVMLKDFPQETTDILRLGEHYFVKLGGNWILSDIFQKWAQDNNVSLPNWFSKGGE